MHAATLDSLALYNPDLLDAAVVTEYDVLDAAGFFDSIKDAFNSVAAKVKKGWKTAKSYIAAGLDSPIGQMITNYASSVPGWGTAIGAGLGALNAAAHDKDWTAIAAEAARKALPGGALRDAAIGVAQGALSAAVRGKGVRGAVGGALGGLAKAGVARLLPKGLPPTVAALASGAADSLPGVLVGGLGMGEKNHRLLAAAAGKSKAKAVASALLQNPNLRGLGTAALAKTLGTTPAQAMTGQRALFRLAGVAGRPQFGASTDAGAMGAGEPAPPGNGFSGGRATGRRARAVPVDGPELSLLVQRMPHLRKAPQFLRLVTAVPGGVGSDAGAIDPVNPRMWVVASGENLGIIAKKLGHPAEPMVLYSVNKSPVGPLTDPNKIYPGQRLRVPDSWIPNLPGAPPPPVPGQPMPSPNPLPTGMQLHHIVQPGETLSSIAADFGHPGEWGAIYAVNKVPAGPLTDPDSIKVGQMLKMPEGWTAPPVGPPSPLPRPGPQPPGPAPVPAPDAKVIAEAQARLAYWGTAYKKIVPADYGQPADFSGTVTPRFTSAVKSFQTWSNQSLGTSLRTDGALDEPTHAQLAYVSGGLMGKGLPVPPNIPGAPQPGPPPPPPPYPVPSPIPRVEPTGQQAPPWYIPGTNPQDYKMPDGTWETYPGQAKGLPLPPGWPGGGQVPPGPPPPLPWPGPPTPPPPAKKSGGAGVAVGLMTFLAIASMR